MKKLATFLILLAGILWGTIGIFVRILDTEKLSSMDIVMLRAMMTVVLLLLYLLVFDRKLLKIKIKDIWCFIGTGVCSIVFFNYCYFKTITYTSLSVAAVLLYTAPAIVMLLSAILFKEKITRIKIISIILTFVGCIFVTGIIGTEENLNLKGIVVGLGAGLGYALYSIFSKFALKKGYQSLTISFYTFLLALFGTIPFCNVGYIIKITNESVKMLLFCILFGLISTVIPYIVYTKGLMYMDNSKASIIASIEPVTASILGIILYGEKINVFESVGVILVLISIVLSNLESKRHS